MMKQNKINVWDTAICAVTWLIAFPAGGYLMIHILKIIFKHLFS